MHGFSNVQKLSYHHILHISMWKWFFPKLFLQWDGQLHNKTLLSRCFYFMDENSHPTTFAAWHSSLHHPVTQQIIVLTTVRRSCMVGDFIFSTRLNGPHLYGTLWHLFPSLAFSWACQCNHNESTWSWHHSSLKHSTHFKSTNFCCTTICPTHSCHYTTVFWSSV